MTDDRTLGPPPVEPLSDVAWARVERGLWARMDGSTTIQIEPERKRRRWVWLTVPITTAAAAAAIVTVVARSDAPPAPNRIAQTELVGSDTGDVRVVSPAKASTSASFNNAYIELAPASTVVMRHDHPTTILERGSAMFTVAPRSHRTPFTVIAGDTTVRVIGTQFRVSRSDERVTVDVIRGVVEVQFRGSPIRIGADQSWSSEHPMKTSSHAPTAAVTTVESNVPDVPTVRQAPAVAGRVGARPAPTRPATAHSNTAKTIVKPAAAPAETVKHAATTKPTVLDRDRLAFEHLASIETTDPTGAMTGYLALSQRSGPWAANALYAAGRLAADRHDPRAETLLTVYVRRFPSGANVADARALLARIQGR